MREKLYTLLKQTTTPIPAALFTYYRQLNLSLEELMLLTQYQVNHGDLSKVSQVMDMPMSNMTVLINQLLEKQHIIMETTTTLDGKIDVVYSFEPLYQKVVTLMEREKPTPTVSAQDLVSVFEQEFGRALSAMELDMISGWVKEDQFDEELILLALKEAVVSQALSLKYIDRILLNWNRKNIKTVQQVKIETQKYRQPLHQDQPIELDDHVANVLLTKHTK